MNEIDEAKTIWIGKIGKHTWLNLWWGGEFMFGPNTLNDKKNWSFYLGYLNISIWRTK